MTVRHFLACALSVSTLAGAAPQALAELAVKTVPFKAMGSITEWMDPSSTNPCAGVAPAYGSAAAGSGSGTGLGSVIGAFSFTTQDCVTSASPYFTPPYAFSSRQFMITTTEGEQILGHYQGTGTLQGSGPLSMNGTFTITGGSGRFANASGAGVLEVVEDISTVPAKGFLKLTGLISPPR